MRFQHGMSIALYAGMLLADITDEMIARTLEWRRDGHEIKRGGPLDVRLGRVMRASGFLGATRYYVPDIKTASKITLDNREIKWERDYIKDQAVATGVGKSLPPPDEGNAARYKERYYQMMIYMFPSVGGSVDIGRGEGDSLVRFLNSQDEGSEGKKSPKILAALMAMGLGAKLDAGDAKTGKPAKTKKSGEMNDIRIKHGEVVDVSVNLRKFPSVRNIVRFFEDGVERDPNSLDNEVKFLPKELLLHAFIHYYFNEYEELESLIDAIYEIVKGDEKVLKECFAEESDAENRDSEAFAALYKAVTDPKSLGIAQTIPFTPATPQVRSEGAYFYNRRGAGGRGEFYPDDEFGDCVEAALLSSLYCLFFDPSQQRCRIKESCGELMGTELAKFIEDYPEPYNMDDTKKERWWRIVEDLDDERIVYCKRRTDDEGHVYRGELCTGLINFLRVVVKICGLDGSEYLSGFVEYREKPSEDDGKRIIEEFKEQFEKAMSRLCSKEVTISYPYGLKMEKVGRSDDDLGWDIVGSVEFNMKDDMGRNGQFTLVQETFHTKLGMKSASVSIPEKKLGELFNHVNELAENPRGQLDNYLNGTFIYFVASIPQLTERFIDVYRGLIKSCNYLALLTITPLQNDEQKIALLKELFPYVVGGGNIRMEWLAENILNSLALDANVISRGVHQLVAFNMRLREDYAAILEKHAMAPGGASGEQWYWLRDYEVRKQCIMSFYDKPELLMYLDEVGIINTIMNHGDNTELCGAVQEIPDAGVRGRINACGFLVACETEGRQLAEYFFSNLEIADDVVSQARELYYKRFEEFPSLQPVTDFFVEMAEAASDETIKKMYSWCLNSNGLHCTHSNIFPFIRMTHRKVGLDFIFDQIIEIRDIDPLYGSSYIYFYEDLLTWMRKKNIQLRQDIYGLVNGYIEMMDHESQVEDSIYFKYDSADEIEGFRRRLAELKSLLEEVAKSRPKGGARAIIYPEILHLPQRILPLRHERMDDPELQNRIGTIISNYEHEDWDLVRIAKRNNKKPKYVSARDSSVAAFFQLVSSKAIDTLSYQKANNAEPGPSGDFNEFYLCDEAGDFRNFLTVYHEKANGELRGLVLTVEEWARVRQVLNALTSSTVVREIAVNKGLLHKLVFSRNIYALAHPLFKATPGTAAAGDSDVEEGAEGSEAVDGDSMQKLFNLVALLHNITSDGAVLEPGDKMDYLLFASFLYPFRLHYKELDSLEDVKVVASCCRSPGSDMNVYPTYLFRWEEIGLPQGYGDNYHLFSYRTIYELTRPLIESIRRSSPERAEVCAREFESIRLVENFDPSSDGNALDEFFKSLKGKRNFTPQADMVLFIVNRRFGYIRPAAAERE